MTKPILDLAREAGAAPTVLFGRPDDLVFTPAHLTAYTDAIKEQCAVICDGEALDAREAKAWLGVFAAEECAAAIRASKEQA